MDPRHFDRPLITSKELAWRLGVSLEAIERWRERGCGPPWYELGPRRAAVRYAWPEVLAWLAAPETRRPGRDATPRTKRRWARRLADLAEIRRLGDAG